jgi:hypothetical protein
MAIRRWRVGLVTGVLAAAAFAGCGDDEDKPASSTFAGSAGEGGAEAGAEAAAGAAGTMIVAGSGGGSGLDASVDGSQGCEIKNLDFGADCMECGKKLCCQPMTACDSDPGCVSLAECVVACPLDDAGMIQSECKMDCAAKQDVISPAYNAMVWCLAQVDPDASDSCGMVCPF